TLSGAEQGDDEEDRSPLAQERGEQLVRFLDRRNLETVPVKDCGTQDQDRRIDEKGGVEGNRGVDEEILARRSLAAAVGADPARLHERRVKVEIVGHHR